MKGELGFIVLACCCSRFNPWVGRLENISLSDEICSCGRVTAVGELQCEESYIDERITVVGELQWWENYSDGVVTVVGGLHWWESLTRS